MKLISLDVGTKRIGVAKADSKVRIAIPYTAVEVNGEEFKKIASLARAWDIKNFVIGLPRNASGEETKQSLYVRQFAKDLKRVIPDAKICFQDESLTSVEAEKRLEKRKKGYKKGDIDSEAAAIILQDFLEEKTGKSTTRAAAARRKSVRGARPHRLLYAVLTLVALIAAAGAGAWAFYCQSLRPVVNIDCETTSADQCEPVVFEVEAGAGVSDVATELKERGLIRSSFVFQVYFRLNAHGESLKAGSYEFTPVMSAEKIAGLLLHGSDSVYSFTVFPGDKIFDVRDDLIDLGYAAADVDAALSPENYRSGRFAWLFAGMPADDPAAAVHPSLEGYLYGDTYEFFRDDPVETVIERLLSETASVIKEYDLESKFAAVGLSLYQGITLASIVQREADTPEDMAKVAQIFLNRLALGMTLGSDVTAQYAADLVDRERLIYTTNASIVEIDSPYNTRKYAGLPYGPVSNPGFDALLAVATPDASVADMLFFLSGDDGQLYFAPDDAGHQWNIANFCQVLCATAL